MQELREEALAGEPSVWVQVMEWGVVIILALLALAVLARAFRRKQSVAEDRERGGARRSVGGFRPCDGHGAAAVQPASEQAAAAEGDDGLRLPDDEPGIVDVFRIYFGMLNLAESRGFERRSYQTPDEFRSRLERIFPGRDSGDGDGGFQPACYGRRPSSEEDIAEMRESLEQVAQSRRRR